MNNAGEVEMLDATEHLVKKIRHPLVVQVHVDHLSFHIWSMFAEKSGKDLAEVCIHKFHHNVEI